MKSICDFLKSIFCKKEQEQLETAEKMYPLPPRDPKTGRFMKRV